MLWKKKQTLYKGKTDFNSVTVTQKGAIVTLWSPSGIRQTEIDTSAALLPRLEYARNSVLSLAFSPCPASMLILGLGGGALPLMFYHIAAEIHIDVVEIDPEMQRIAEKYFGFFTDSRLKLFIDDAARYIRQTDTAKRYDIIILDAYIGHKQHDSLTSEEFFSAAARRLNPGGVLVANLLTKKRSRFETMKQRIASVFGDLWLLPGETSTNTLVFAKKEVISRFDILKNSLALPAYKGIPGEIPVEKLAGKVEEVPKVS